MELNLKVSVLCVLIHSALISLIWRGKSFGRYRYLLLTFSALDILISLLHSLTIPVSISARLKLVPETKCSN